MKGDTSFGQALREARKRAGLSQMEVAVHIEVADNRISNIENAKERPLSYAKTLKVAALLKVSPARLLHGRARWHDELPVYRTGDERRDLVAAALSVEWAILSPAAIDRIAREVGL